VDSPDEYGEVGLAIPYEMFKDYVVEHNAGDIAGDVLVQIPENDDLIHIPSGDGEAGEYIWTLRVTQSVADGRSVLVSVSLYFMFMCF